ncbi:SLC16A12 [Bugula neritina]|uniref:SLC16A12 n=1 Tax=Bugula neritina TaxID=10212 RepID=A0A7J7JUM4_BUGNE|nr:SLC16A12 [Bugula neritina]
MLAHSISIGFSYGILGSFTVAQSKYLNLSIYESSWTGATHLSTFFLTTPLTTALAKNISPSLLQITGGVLMLLGVGATAWAKEQWHSILSFGLVTGLGISLVRSASAAALPFYFQNEFVKFAMASVMIGFTIGMSALPLVCNYIFSMDDFPKTMFDVSKIMFLHLLCGLIFLPISIQNPEAKGIKTQNLTKSEVYQGVVLPLVKIIKSFKVWSYLLAALLRRFALTAFFTLITNYLMIQQRLSGQEVAQFRMTLGCMSVVGVVAMCITQNEKFNRLIPHAIGPFICGVVMMSITLAENDISLSMLMALFGLAFGSLLGNTTPAINTLVSEEEVKLVLMLECIMDGLGSVGGSPSTSYIQEETNLNTGLYFAGAFCMLSGLIMLLLTACKIREDKSRKDYSEEERTTQTIIRIKPYDHSQSKFSVKQVNVELLPLLSSDMASP